MGACFDWVRRCIAIFVLLAWWVGPILGPTLAATDLPINEFRVEDADSAVTLCANTHNFLTYRIGVAFRLADLSEDTALWAYGFDGAEPPLSERNLFVSRAWVQAAGSGKTWPGAGLTDLEPLRRFYLFASVDLKFHPLRGLVPRERTVQAEDPCDTTAHERETECRREEMATGCHCGPDPRRCEIIVPQLDQAGELRHRALLVAREVEPAEARPRRERTVTSEASDRPRDAVGPGDCGPSHFEACLAQPGLYWDQQTKCCTDRKEPCTDPDGGRNYSQQAHTFGFQDERAYPQNVRIRVGGRDRCRSETVVVEHYCYDTYYADFEFVECPGGCDQGACLSEVENP